MKKPILLPICLLLVRGAFADSSLPPDGTDLGEQFREFAKIKEAETRRTAAAKGMDMPAELVRFFGATTSNQWSKAENIFANIRNNRASSAASLAAGMHDVSGFYCEMGAWNMELATLFSSEALRAVPDGAIFVGGSDEGRFFTTFSAETMRQSKVTVITQNALADENYADYLRYALKDRMNFYSKREATTSFQQYVEEVQSGERDAKGSITTEGGRIQITGVNAVMQLNGMLVRRLFELNRATRPFYVEESYVIEWMYDYLTPHGLIMKLNAQPLVELPLETVTADRAYWNKLEAKLNATPSFKETEDAHTSFAKCRCAIAGLYEYHGMHAEAEAAFRQALRLCPTSAEANARLAKLLKRSGKPDATSTE